MFLQEYLHFVYNYIHQRWKTIISISLFSLILLFILLFILWIVISYYILKWFRKNIDQNLFFNNYTYNSINNLKKYGDLPIKNIYLARQPINKYLLKALNIISFYDYNKKVKMYIEKNKCNAFFPFHTYIIIEVEMPNKFRKHLIIEKNNSININSSYNKKCNQELLKININKKKYTVNTILENTKKRIGVNKFFNWHIYKNNCQKFTEEILTSLNKKNKKYTNFIYQNDFIKNFETSEFTIHILNCSINLINMFEHFTNIYLF